MKKYITKIALVSTLLLSLNATAGWFWEKSEPKVDHVWNDQHSHAWNVMKQVDLEINEYTKDEFDRNFGKLSEDTLYGPVDFKSNASLGGAIYGALGGGLWGATAVGMDNNQVFDDEKESYKIGVFPKETYPTKESVKNRHDNDLASAFKIPLSNIFEYKNYWSIVMISNICVCSSSADVVNYSKTTPKEFSFFVAPNDRTPWAKQPMLINQGKVYLPIVD